jgi:hypothetical protein
MRARARIGRPVLGLPIFDGGRRKAGFKVARADYDAAIAAYDATLNLALEEVADAVTSQRALEQRLTESRQAQDAASRGWRLAKRRYTAGATLTSRPSWSPRTGCWRTSARSRPWSRVGFILDLALVRALGGGWREEIMLRRDLSAAGAPELPVDTAALARFLIGKVVVRRDARQRHQRPHRRDRGLCRRRRRRARLSGA